MNDHILTKDELHAVKFYLDRPHMWRGFSDATQREIQGLVDRLDEAMRAAPEPETAAAGSTEPRDPAP